MIEGAVVDTHLAALARGRAIKGDADASPGAFLILEYAIVHIHRKKAGHPDGSASVGSFVAFKTAAVDGHVAGSGRAGDINGTAGIAEEAAIGNGYTLRIARYRNGAELRIMQSSSVIVLENAVGNTCTVRLDKPDGASRLCLVGIGGCLSAKGGADNGQRIIGMPPCVVIKRPAVRIGHIRGKYAVFNDQGRRTCPDGGALAASQTATGKNEVFQCKADTIRNGQNPMVVASGDSGLGRTVGSAVGIKTALDCDIAVNGSVVVTELECYGFGGISTGRE